MLSSRSSSSVPDNNALPGAGGTTRPDGMDFLRSGSTRGGLIGSRALGGEGTFTLRGEEGFFGAGASTAGTGGGGGGSSSSSSSSARTFSIVRSLGVGSAIVDGTPNSERTSSTVRPLIGPTGD